MDEDHRSWRASCDAQGVIDQLDEYPEWGDAINSLTCSMGVEASRGVFMLPDDAVLPESPFDIVWTHNDGESTTTQTFSGYVVIDRYAAVEIIGSPVIVTVADSRQLWLKAFTNRRFNCQRYFDTELMEGTSNADAYYTPQQIADLLCGEIGITAPLFDSGRQLANLYFDHYEAWRAVGRVADLCGYRVGVNPYTGQPIAALIEAESSVDWLPSGIVQTDICNDPGLVVPGSPTTFASSKSRTVARRTTKRHW